MIHNCCQVVETKEKATVTNSSVHPVKAESLASPPKDCAQLIIVLWWDRQIFYVAIDLGSRS